MTDTKAPPGTFELLSKTMDEIARKIGEMNPDDPVRAQHLQELCALSQLRRSFKSEQNKIIDKRMGELAREIVELPPEHPRRAQIVGEILHLSELISK